MKHWPFTFANKVNQLIQIKYKGVHKGAELCALLIFPFFKYNIVPILIGRLSMMHSIRLVPRMLVSLVLACKFSISSMSLSELFLSHIVSIRRVANHKSSFMILVEAHSMSPQSFSIGYRDWWVASTT